LLLILLLFSIFLLLFLFLPPPVRPYPNIFYILIEPSPLLQRTRECRVGLAPPCKPKRERGKGYVVRPARSSTHRSHSALSPQSVALPDQSVASLPPPPPPNLQNRSPENKPTKQTQYPLHHLKIAAFGFLPAKFFDGTNPPRPTLPSLPYSLPVAPLALYNPHQSPQGGDHERA
jgi:hypothetical protein